MSSVVKITKDKKIVLLGVLKGADLNKTTDQKIVLTGGNKRIEKIVLVNASIDMATAAGGIYDAISKGGAPYVAAVQSYSALKKIDALELTLAHDYIKLNDLWLSLTTAEGVAATCDIYIFGEIFN